MGQTRSRGENQSFHEKTIEYWQNPNFQKLQPAARRSAVIFIFRELQRRSPGRYHPMQIRTLQRGMRNTQAYFLETREEQWQAEVIRGPSLPTVSSAENPATIS